MEKNEEYVTTGDPVARDGPGGEAFVGRGSQHALILPARICLLAAAIGASYLAAMAFIGGPIAGCGPESGCDRVLSSQWAYWLGLPVSVPALAAYACLFAATFSVTRAQTVSVRQASAKVIVMLGLLVLTAGLWFVLVQRFVVHAWCIFCLATHVSAGAAACLLLVAVWRGRSKEGSAPGVIGLNVRAIGAGVCGAMVGLAMLVGGQLVVKKQVYGVTNISRQLGATSKQVSIHHGRFTLDPSRLPVLGSSAASNFIVSVFDYTCGHCRALHELLRAAEKKHSGRLGIITLPMPLDAACNPLIFVTASGNQDACKYARLSLAVWHSKPEMFGQFDDWLFDSTSPPAVDLVYAKAVAMVGKESLDRSLESVWVTRQLQTNIEIYEANSRLIRDGRLPQLVLGNVITHGAIESLEQLLALIERHTPVGQSGSSDVRPETRQSRP